MWFAAAALLARAAGATSYVDCNSDAAQFKVDRCVYLIDASRSSLSDCEYFQKYALCIPAGCCTTGRLAPTMKLYIDHLKNIGVSCVTACGGVGASHDAMECSNESVRVTVEACEYSHSWLQETEDFCRYAQAVATCSPPGCCEVYYERSYAKYLLSKSGVRSCPSACGTFYPSQLSQAPCFGARLLLAALAAAAALLLAHAE
jgi:hypothetical protein